MRMLLIQLVKVPSVPSDDGHEPQVEDQDGQDDADESAELPDGGHELPLELRQELHEANAAYEAAHSVNSVTPGVKHRLNNAKQAAGVMRRKGPHSSRDAKTAQTIQEIKNRTLCGACGKSGHWHDDP